MPHPVVHAEIRSADPDATRKFFAELFGWQYSDGAYPGYTFVDTGVDGALPTAISPLQGDEDAVLFFIGVENVAQGARAGGRVGRPHRAGSAGGPGGHIRRLRRSPRAPGRVASTAMNDQRSLGGARASRRPRGAALPPARLGADTRHDAVLVDGDHEP